MGLDPNILPAVLEYIFSINAYTRFFIYFFTQFNFKKHNKRRRLEKLALYHDAAPPYTPLDTIVLWCSKGFQGFLQLVTMMTREIVSRTAIMFSQSDNRLNINSSYVNIRAHNWYFDKRQMYKYCTKSILEIF